LAEVTCQTFLPTSAGVFVLPFTIGVGIGIEPDADLISTTKGPRKNNFTF
jgi:hypothetical protein